MVIRERGRRIREVARVLGERFRDSQVGTTQRALTLDDGKLAVTGNYLKLRLPPGRAPTGRGPLSVTAPHPGGQASGRLGAAGTGPRAAAGAAGCPK